MDRHDGTPEPTDPTHAETGRKPYTTPDLTDHGSLEDHTQTRPFGGGGPDIGSS